MFLDWLGLFLQIMVINIVLSGDNAVVIALACKNLPLHQRKQAVWWGAFGAVALRLILTVAAVYLLEIPYIQALGSVLLFWIAVKLLIGDDKHQATIKGAGSLSGAIWTIVVADFVMSLDNVLAIAAKAQGDVSIIIVGITLSIPIIIWGSELVMNLLNKYPVLVYLGAGILGYTAGELFIHDKVAQELLLRSLPAGLVPLIAAAVVIAAGWIGKMIKPHAASSD